ncbi:cellulose binding domain-containing protein [Massilia luteola]|uniref:cellulose binding domain-containing protein n=1 Tax=Massilia luteola TaxID=3081751 RepID=UPI002ACC29E5|nr:cellulose binding domain-containing protein [Massilia sp. Gc5]
MKSKRIAALLAAGLLCSGAAMAENYHWGSVAIGGGGYVTGVVASKAERGVVYARTDVGGAYRRDAGGNRWEPLLDWVSDGETGYLGVESLAVDPNDAANVYLLAGTSYLSGGKTIVLHSTDYGKTFAKTDVSAQFKAHGNGMGRQSGEKLQVDPGDGTVVYAGTRRDGLFRSTDAGATWELLAGLPVTSTPNDNGISFVLLDPTSVDSGRAQRIFVGVSRYGSVGPNLYFSYDGGVTFDPVEGGPSGLMPQRAVLSPDGLLVVTYANGAGPYGTGSEPMDQGQIWAYDAAGGNWTNITPPGITSAFGGVSMDPNDPKHLVASTINTWRLQHDSAYGDRIYSTRDGGQTWSDVVQRGFSMDSQGADWIRTEAIHWAGDIEFDPFDTRQVWVTSGNGLFKSADIDAATPTWTFDVKGLEETVPLNAASVAGAPLVSAIGDYDGFIHPDVDTYGAIHTPRMGTTSGLAVAALNPQVMARAGNALYYTTNGGASWNQAGTMNGTQGQLALSADGYVLLHSPANGTTTYRSTNFGTSWTPVAGLTANSARPVADAVNPAKFYAYDNGKFLVSTDGGASFAVASALAGGGSNVIRAVPAHEGDVWVCLNGGGLAHTVDGGANFAKVDTVAACGAIGIGKAAPGTNYPALYMWGTVGTVHGMLRSTDKGVTWVRVNDDEHEYGGPGNGQFVVGDMNTYGAVYMGTSGRGLVYGMTAEGGEVPVVPVTSTTPPATGPVNRCDYVVTASWSGGYNAAIRITNNGTAPVNGWTVNWTYTDGSVVQSSWNALVTGTPPTYTATANQSWNTVIYPGSTVEFGITVSGSALPVVTGDVCN